jgi:hypothetical protein
LADITETKIHQEQNYNPSGKKTTRLSHFWTGLMKVKESHLSLGTFQLNNVENVRL